MKREAFKIFLKPGCEAEYEKRHREICPELKKLLSDNGVYDYSIYWDKEANILFCLSENKGRRIFTRHGKQPYCTEMVGLYGRHYENKS
ncbi:L-rhamnose mutarotase [termite gut metagenome]|uniref:L-rhamnose mutarotase n=1 Tax=termite gut metagenome TaxID=433724 RepID=A0A5J4R8F3_9ZZZZ